MKILRVEPYGGQHVPAATSPNGDVVHLDKDVTVLVVKGRVAVVGGGHRPCGVRANGRSVFGLRVMRAPVEVATGTAHWLVELTVPRAALVGKQCPLCGSLLGAEEALAACWRCGIGVHQECMAALSVGRPLGCVTVGCHGRWQEAPAAGTAGGGR